VQSHVAKHSIRSFRDASDEVMKEFRGLLEKINDGRNKTDNMIEGIKDHMNQIENDASSLEKTVRSKVFQLKQILEAKEREIISYIHGQK